MTNKGGPRLRERPVSERIGWEFTGGGVAAAYERYIMAPFGNAWAQALAQLAAPEDGDRVLDLACGTGAVARYTAPLVGAAGRVVGVDINVAMIDVARAIAAPEGAAIEWRQADAMALPFPDASFDLVCCQQGLQFFTDRPAALGEMFRVLVPGGRLAIAVWRGLAHQPFYNAVAEALDRHVGPEPAERLRAAFALADAAELRSLVGDAGFRNVHIRIRSRLTRYPSLPDFVQGYVSGTPLSGAVAAVDEAARRAMVEHVCAALRDHVDDDGMAAPWEAHLVTAHT